MKNTDLQNQMANAIRFLAIDAIEQANSGHPGLPMGAADIATVLYTRAMKYDPQNPDWPNRDRFILSAGHGSMLLYAALCLIGCPDVTIEDLKNFRKLGSKTAGHPEYGHIGAIETTTGPLGQGLANAVGMAIAERLMNARFKSLIDHYTYVLVGDGCLMEGISQEAISLAGSLELNKLIVLWDNNNISIDGTIDIADKTDQAKRFEAVGWNVIKVDGHNQNEIAQAIEEAKKSLKPTLIDCKTVIGFGSPNRAGTSKVHGSPLGSTEVEETRNALGWSQEAFEVPQDILDNWRLAGLSGARAHQLWQEEFNAVPSDERLEFLRLMRGEIASSLDEKLNEFKMQLSETKPKLATRQASQNVLEVMNTILTETIGGSADLTSSNNTKTSQMQPISASDFSGRYIHYGIREHAMGAAMNGIALYGGFIPYGGTFLCFSDYVRPAMRMSSLMGIRVIYVMTHDSIGLGEDGPTHQPVEHLASLRAMPNHYVFRPADAVETLEAWQIAIKSEKTPSTLALTRQAVPTLRINHEKDNMSAKGAYEIRAASDDAVVSIFASGSEVAIAIEAADLLEEQNIAARVVSVPCFELYDKQEKRYKDAIIGDAPIRIAVEPGVEMGWHKFIGEDGIFIGMHSFGASGPMQQLYEHFGITAQNIVNAVKAKIAECNEVN